MGKIKTTPITVVDSISKEDFLKHYYKPQKPVLIKNLTREWKAFEKWNLDYIQERAGDQIVPLYNNQVTKGKQYSAEPATKMRLYDYIEILKKGPTDLRIFFYNILDNMPELAKDFTYPDLGMKFFKRLPVMFFGSMGSKVLPHYDMDLSDLMHFHFHGHKNVLLFPPEQTKYIYRIPHSVHNLETIDLDNPDFEKYPGLKYLDGLEANMEHGDALYMPSGYWHYIKYLDGSFSLTIRAFSRKPKTFLNMLYNVFIMRHFENLMRKWRGQKWLDYKDTKAIAQVEKAIKSL